MKCKLTRIVSICLCIMIFISINAYAEEGQKIYKEESVYGLLEYNGTQKNIIVSDYIHSNQKLNTLKDFSMLDNIHNLKNSQSPNINNQDIEWNIDGYELYYQGQSSLELPVKTTIKYYLNNIEMDKENIIGKSGDLKIIIHQDNLVSEIVDINGVKREIYSPFYSVATITLPTGNFTNVELNQGKILNDGNHFVVMGVLMPGMKENLCDLEDLEIYDDLIITAKVENFQMNPIYIAITNELPEVEDIEVIDQIDKLNDTLNKIEQAGGELVSGSTELYNAQDVFNEKFNQATLGLKEYFENINTLSEGLKNFGQPVFDLNKGMADLADGLVKWQENISPLVDGIIKFAQATEEFAYGADSLTEKVNYLAEGLDALPSGIKQLSNSSIAITKGAKTFDDGLLDLANGTNELYSQMLKFKDILDPNSTEFKMYSEILGQMGSLSSSSNVISNNMNDFYDNIVEFNNGVNKLESESEIFVNAPQALQEGITQLKDASKLISENAMALSSGLKQAAEGTTTIVVGSKELKEGTNQLYNKIEEVGEKLPGLDSATLELTNGVTQLNDASSKILTGTKDLKDGVLGFNEEAILKVSEEIKIKQKDLDNIIEIKEQLEKLSNEYNNFSGTKEDFISSIKFLLKTEQIK